MAYRNKVYVGFDADNDIHYYRLMTAWKQNDNSLFDFQNAHDLNTILPSSSEETIKRRLRERFSNTKLFILLVGEQTRYLYKFVRWETELALNLNLPIIAVNLNGKRSVDTERCPPIIREELAIHISFNPAIIQYALEHWEQKHYELGSANKTGPYYYQTSVYEALSL